MEGAERTNLPTAKLIASMRGCGHTFDAPTAFDQIS
jgi:hypothetical protein